jgi:hypothetical protein
MVLLGAWQVLLSRSVAKRTRWWVCPPLIRNELMGHVPAGLSAPGGGLAMTAVYTHTRPETKRRQLENAFANRAVIQHATQWLQSRCSTPACRR